MKIRALLAERLAIGGLLAVGALVVLAAAPMPAAAQEVANPGARWDAWLGCWEGAQTPVGVKTPLMCVVPSTGYSAVDILTVTDGKITAREHIDASGEHIKDSRDGCTGWQSAQWSRDNERVYLRADYVCENGVHRDATSLIAMTADGDWMEVQGLQAAQKGGVRVLEYKLATNPGPLPPEIDKAIGDRSLAIQAGRVAASAPLNVADIAEASQHLDSAVVQAWLVDRGGQMKVTGKELVQLANAGVPGSVTDVLVALANPNKFAFQAGSHAAQGQYGEAPSATALAGTVDTTSQRLCPYSAYAWNFYGQCAYSPYAYMPWGYNPAWGYDPYNYYGLNSYYGGWYGPYSGYGYGYGYGYGGWYPFGYTQPVVIVPNNGTSNPSGHGRLVYGRGYVQGNAGSGSSGNYVPSSNAYGGRTAHQTGGNYSPPPSASSGSSNAGSSSSGRTAHRTGGGGGR